MDGNFEGCVERKLGVEWEHLQMVVTVNELVGLEILVH